MRRYLPLLAALFFLIVLAAYPQSGSQLRFCLASHPKTFDRLIVIDETSETVCYLTGEVLLRLNRETQQFGPALAASPKVSVNGRSITFTLLDHLRFSDTTCGLPQSRALIAAPRAAPRFAPAPALQHVHAAVPAAS